MPNILRFPSKVKSDVPPDLYLEADLADHVALTDALVQVRDRLEAITEELELRCAQMPLLMAESLQPGQ